MQKREVKIAIILGVVMLLIIGGIFIYYKNFAYKTSDILDVKVYIHDEENSVYKECKTSTENLLIISREYEKAIALKDSKQLSGVSINGNYKVKLGDEYIAFDNSTDNYFYSGSKNVMYSFTSKLYEEVIKVCENT